MTDVFKRAATRRQIAECILSDLGLIEKWGRFGRPAVVGAVACDLVVAPDIDLEIYCPHLVIEHGFCVLSECAHHPKVTRAQFANELSGRDKALYWQLRYTHDDGVEWKIDMWSAPDDYALPRGEHLAAAMCAMLTAESRGAILDLKERALRDAAVRCPSVDLYRAVVEDDVRTRQELVDWLETHQTGALTHWQPEQRKA